MVNRKVRVSEAAKMLGVTAQTLRNWEKAGKLCPERSVGNQRYYLLEQLQQFTVDIEQLGKIWATSGVAPEIPSKFYCERQDRFLSRLSKMANEIEIDPHISKKLASLLTLVAGEVGDNSFAHNIGNWPDTPGIFYAYDFQKRIIVVADRGRGVITTLRNVRPSIANDLEALTVAFHEVLSGRNPEKRGNGLKVVRDTVKENEIGLFYQSGIGTAKIPIKKSSDLIVLLCSK